MDVPGVRATPAKCTKLAWLKEKAEGEGFEPSIRLTTDNGFRDRYEYADLQGF
jgi:hypothetical protein